MYVDAFALSVIKAERQLRKLFTFSIYQFPIFSESDIPELRKELSKRKVYFDGIENGINSLLPSLIEELVGDRHAYLRESIHKSIGYRNKIFHGQVTSRYLKREDLLDLVADIREWCELLAYNANSRIGYDGFKRNSFQKSVIPNLADKFKVQFTDLSSYTKFIKSNMERNESPQLPKT